MGIPKTKKRKFNPIVNIKGEEALRSKRRRVGTGARAQKQSNKGDFVSFSEDLNVFILTPWV